MYYRNRLFCPRAAALLAALCFSGAGFAQDGGGEELRLFEPVQNQEEEDSAQRARTLGNRQGQNAGGGEPAFSLVGTSRFGDRHIARLRGSDGEVIRVEGDPGGEIPVPGHPGFTVAGIGSGEVEVRHPEDEPCVESREDGVSCAGGNTARLQLATAEPVEPPRERRNRGRGGDSESGEDQEADGGPADNPFAAALRASRNQDEEARRTVRERRTRNRGRRIDPDDVPEGMRVVRTPFGDRLVEE